MLIKTKRQNLPLRHQSIGWDLKPWFHLHMTLTVGGSLNTNTAIVSGPAPPWLDPRVPFMRNSRDFCQGMVGGILSADSAGPGLARQIQTVWNWRYFWFFFHYTLSRNKGARRLPVHRLVWAFVIRMYQRRISRDKVYKIFKNSKFNVKVYTRYTSSDYVEGV